MRISDCRAVGVTCRRLSDIQKQLSFPRPHEYGPGREPLRPPAVAPARHGRPAVTVTAQCHICDRRPGRPSRHTVTVSRERL